MTPETKKKVFEWTRTIVIAVAISLLFRAYVVEARWIPSESMNPTLAVGDRLFVDKISYQFSDISRGDIVVFEAPTATHLEEDLIKRVIAIPGDTIKIEKGIVYINGEPLTEPYEKEQPREDFKETKIPEDSVFVMGDNRNNSYDSRYWGVLPMDKVIGKAVVRYFPFNKIGLID